VRARALLRRRSHADGNAAVQAHVAAAVASTQLQSRCTKWINLRDGCARSDADKGAQLRMLRGRVCRIVEARARTAAACCCTLAQQTAYAHPSSTVGRCFASQSLREQRLRLSARPEAAAGAVRARRRAARSVAAVACGIVTEPATTQTKNDPAAPRRLRCRICRSERSAAWRSTLTELSVVSCPFCAANCQRRARSASPYVPPLALARKPSHPRSHAPPPLVYTHHGAPVCYAGGCHRGAVRAGACAACCAPCAEPRSAARPGVRGAARAAFAQPRGGAPATNRGARLRREALRGSGEDACRCTVWHTAPRRAWPVGSAADGLAFQVGAQSTQAPAQAPVQVRPGRRAMQSNTPRVCAPLPGPSRGLPVPRTRAVHGVVPHAAAAAGGAQPTSLRRPCCASGGRTCAS
jgi:hypothetical protein